MNAQLVGRQEVFGRQAAGRALRPQPVDTYTGWPPGAGVLIDIAPSPLPYAPPAKAVPTSPAADPRRLESARSGSMLGDQSEARPCTGAKGYSACSHPR